MNKLIHHTTVVYLALIMLLRMTAMPLSLLDYSINRNYITSTLCENRSRPEIHCFGKCYLNKQLAKANESQESRGQKGSSKNSTVDFFEKTAYPVFTCENSRHPVYLFVKESAVPSTYSGNIFHPPIA